MYERPSRKPYSNRDVTFLEAVPGSRITRTTVNWDIILYFYKLMDPCNQLNSSKMCEFKRVPGKQNCFKVLPCSVYVCVRALDLQPLQR